MLMQKVRAKFRQIQYRLKRDMFTPQNIILFVAILLCAYFLVGAIGATSRNWSLQAKLDRLLISEQRTKIEVETLKLEQEYYQTNEYQELMAREKLGKMLPGETMVTLEKNSEDAKNKDSQDTETSSTQRSNISMWMDLIFGD